jgi:hypothetical protein
VISVTYTRLPAEIARMAPEMEEGSRRQLLAGRSAHRFRLAADETSETTGCP